ncbi:MAG: VWA domain-containing protein [Ramlibacter sp.]
MKKHPPRILVALLSAQLMLMACTATAHTPLPAEPTRWPEPQTQNWPQGVPLVRTVPNFQAPSANNCARPIQTREVPGRPQGQAGNMELRERMAKSAPAESAGSSFAAPAPAPAAAARAESGALADTARKSASPPFASSFAPPQPQRQQQPQQAVVTAGMVDDNADFSSYLAFRNRTRVEHRARDIRERYLLEVKDSRGRGIADAEVAVQAPTGHAMWARTDTAGRVWLHPNAFDPSRSPWYDVAVRKDGRQAVGRLQRGQKSSVEVVLDARAAETRARLDLVFLIDATGSMADEIDKLKATLRTIAADVARLPSQPDLCFGLVAYRDKGDAFLVRSHDLTNDLAAFQGVLNNLHAAGGGDYPEAMNEALHETVHNLSWRGDGATRLVVLLADAPPHLDYGGPYYDDDMVAALGKGIKVFSVGASGLDKQGEFIQRQIAQYTGGRFVFLTYAQAHNPASGPGRETVHDVNNYSVDTLDRLVVRLVSEELGKLARGS